jgi:hypothetical protein
MCFDTQIEIRHFVTVLFNIEDNLKITPDSPVRVVPACMFSPRC